jgi:hypothetical protein
VLPRFSSPQPIEIENMVEELKEALLDLKQGYIERDHVRVTKHKDEVQLLLAELRGF